MAKKPFGRGGGPPEEGSYDPDINPNVNFDQVELERFVKRFEESLTKSLDNVKKTMEKSLNFKGVQEDFENLFIKAAKKVASQHQKGMKDAIGNTSNLQKSYYNLVSTKERKAFNLLKSNVDKTHNKLKANVKKEESFRKNIFETAKRNHKKLSADELKALEISTKKQESAAKQVFKLKKTQQAALVEADYKARASEGKVGVVERLGKRLGGGGVKKGLSEGAQSIPLLSKFVKGLNVWSLAFTALFAVLAKLFGAAIAKRRDLTKVQLAFKNAGMSASEASKATERVGKAFNTLKLASFGIDPERLRNEILKPLGEYPLLLTAIGKEAGKSATEAVNLSMALAGLGKDLPSSIKFMGEASKGQAIAIEDLTEKTKLARGASRDSAMSFDQAANTLLNLNKALRNVTFDSQESEKMFAFISSTLNDMKGALQLGGDEIQDFIMSLGKGVAGLKFTDIAGMLKFIGKDFSGATVQKVIKEGGLFELQLRNIAKVMGGDLKGSFVELSEGGVSKLFGALDHFKTALPDFKAMPQFFEMLNQAQKVMGKEDSSKFSENAKKLAKNMKISDADFRKLQAEGMKALKDLTTPGQKLSAALNTLADRGIPRLNAGIMGLIRVMEKVAGVMSGDLGALTRQRASVPMLQPGLMTVAPPKSIHRDPRTGIESVDPNRAKQQELLNTDQWKPL